MSSSAGVRTQAGPQQNTALVQQIYAAFGRGDIAAIVNEMADDVDWHAVVGAGPNVPTHGPRRGRKEVTKFFDQVATNLDFKRFEPQEFVAEGDKVIALGYYEGIAKPTGRGFKSEWVMVFTIQNGKVTRFREFADAVAITAAF